MARRPCKWPKALRPIWCCWTEITRGERLGRLWPSHPKWPSLPVVVITARPNQLFTALAAGVGALVEKPLHIPKLLQTISRLLRESVEPRLARLAGKVASSITCRLGREPRQATPAEPPEPFAPSIRRPAKSCE